MATARDTVTPDPACIDAESTVLEVAQRLARLDVGALPIWGTDDGLKGMLTDRDVATKIFAEGKDPALTIGADDDASEILHTMTEHHVRRLPVIDGHDLVGIVVQADVARALPDTRVGSSKPSRVGVPEQTPPFSPCSPRPGRKPVAQHPWRRYAVAAAALITAALLARWAAIAVVRDVHAASV
ncbi:CBS domain-containing protein [Streptomyces sp. NPDC058682]|uniref:CBS domain-containing protein n=1 Tax=Streptomyces sp. NPDC058682 TaxID=3346596 RepID=UPI00365CF5DC